MICAANLGFSSSSGTGSVSSTVTAGPAGCSGVFNAIATVSGRSSSNSTQVIVPPQIMIRTLVGEAAGQTAPGDDTMPAVLLVAKNRFGDGALRGGSAATWQSVLDPLEFYGAANTTPNGVQPELNYAASVFSGASTVSIPADCKSYWSPTDAQYATLQTWAGVPANTKTDPDWHNVGAAGLWLNQPKQAVIKSSIANNTEDGKRSAPAIVLFRPAPSGTASAVITIP